jgi:hypothetical protein
MAIETNVVGETVSVTGVDVIPPHVAVTLVLPAATDIANPLEPVALLIVPTDVVADTQVTCVVKFLVELSVYAPMATNCWVVPSGIFEAGGVMAIETSVADVTVRVVDAEVTLFNVAVTTELPALTASALPSVGRTEATAVLDELQATCAVTSALLLSL